MHDDGAAGSRCLPDRGGRTIPELARLQRAAWAFTTRRIPRRSCSTILSTPKRPEAGDVVLARVDAIGQHGGLQLTNGRRRTLFEGDEIVVVYGNRYASNQFEAVVPETLGPCHLVAGGGVAGKARSWHARMQGPTHITPIGLLGDASHTPVRVQDYALQPAGELVSPCKAVVAVIGTGMDSGKTQSAAYLVKGLTRTRRRVGYAKVTGTGAGGDTWLLKDAGADPVVDFLDAGLVSTFLASPEEIERVFRTLIDFLSRARVDAIVLEIADGILQCETAALIASPVFRQTVTAILFTACDAMGALAGWVSLRDRNLPIVGFGGVLTAAPLQIGEVVQATGLPAYDRAELARPQLALRILAGLPVARIERVPWRER